VLASAKVGCAVNTTPKRGCATRRRNSSKDTVGSRAVAGEILDQRSQALQAGGAIGFPEVAAQALRPTFERLDRQPLDQLLDHGRRQRTSIDFLLERKGKQLDDRRYRHAAAL
jgi:hypothetical protein